MPQKECCVPGCNVTIHDAKRRPLDSALLISRPAGPRRRPRREPDSGSSNVRDSLPEAIPFSERLKRFLAVHWKGFSLIVIVGFAAIVAFGILSDGSDEKEEETRRQKKESQLVAFTVLVMGLFWVLEVIPLPMSAVVPVSLFPAMQIMDTATVTLSYINATIALFLSSLFLASAIEQSGLHTRIALRSIKLIGYSHRKMLASMMGITMFVSMWITNTAATSMMIPIIFALLKIFEENKAMEIYEKDASGEEYATPLTVCYFCAATYSATIGGIGTVVGTGTNLVLQSKYIELKAKSDSDDMTFLMFSVTTIPIMLMLIVTCYTVLAVQFLGLFRSKSKAAQASHMAPETIAASKQFVLSELKKLGSMKQSEILAGVLFISAMIMLFLRSPEMFSGWGDFLGPFYDINKKKIKDSDFAFLISFIMFAVPAYDNSCKHCTAKYREELPKKSSKSVVDWAFTNSRLPYSFAFLLGGGFALSDAAGEKYTNFINFLADTVKPVAELPYYIAIFVFIVFTVFITNFCSNVVTATLLMPLAMKLAPLRYQIQYAFSVGLSASYCFCLPVGTPGNLIVQSKAKIRTFDMIKAGLATTLLTIVIQWVMLLVWPPLLFNPPPESSMLTTTTAAATTTTPTTTTPTTTTSPP